MEDKVHSTAEYISKRKLFFRTPNRKTIAAFTGKPMEDPSRSPKQVYDYGLKHMRDYVPNLNILLSLKHYCKTLFVYIPFILSDLTIALNMFV